MPIFFAAVTLRYRPCLVRYIFHLIGRIFTSRAIRRSIITVTTPYYTFLTMRVYVLFCTHIWQCMPSNDATCQFLSLIVDVPLTWGGMPHFEIQFWSSCIYGRCIHFHCRYATRHTFTRHIFAHSIYWILYAAVWICSWRHTMRIRAWLSYRVICNAFSGLHVFITSTWNSCHFGAFWITLPLKRWIFLFIRVCIIV